MSLKNKCDALRRELWHMQHTLDMAHDVLEEMAVMAMQLNEKASALTEAHNEEYDNENKIIERFGL